MAQCLSSLARQSYSALQILLINDGSTDESKEIAEAFCKADKRFCLINQSNQGLSAARNTGLQHACGEYVLFTDSDDFLDTYTIERLIDAIGDADVVQYGYKRVLDDGRVVKTDIPSCPYQLTSACLRLYKRMLFDTYALTFTPGMIYEDIIFSLNLWAHHPTIHILPFTGYNYRINVHSITAHHSRKNIRTLYRAIRETQAPLWLKIYTRLRLLIHFLKS
ncbi:MAG: glycosyltransferase [Bacteroidales bacterium]|nr:glycosyltransferase [Candidatus Colicola coprequi]